MRHTLYTVECLSFPMFMRAFNLLIKYFVHNIVSWVEQEDSRASGGGAVRSAVLWLAQAGLSLVSQPQLGLWLADCRDQAGSPCHVAWCKHWPHVTHVSWLWTRVWWENANQDVCVHMSDIIIKCDPMPCQRDKNMSAGAAWVLFVYLSSGRAGPQPPEGS